MSEAPDYAEPLIAWRAWTMVRAAGELRLASVLYPSLWQPGVAHTSSCLRGWAPWRRRHGAPGFRCTCGIYGARQPDGALIYLHRSMAKAGAPRAIGRVRLWGRVVEARDGWRAQFAYPDLIVLPGDGRQCRSQRGLIGRIGDYGIPVIAAAGGELDAVLRAA